LSDATLLVLTLFCTTDKVAMDSRSAWLPARRQ